MGFPHFLCGRQSIDHLQVAQGTGKRTFMLVMARHSIDWVIERYVLRASGVVVAGLPLEPLIDPVDSEELRRAMVEALRNSWAPRLTDPAWLLRTGYQAFTVLTKCRALYTLQHGTVASKLVSGQWARTALGKRWAELIDRALA